MTRRRIFETACSWLPVLCALAAATIVICDAIGVSLNPDYNPIGESISDLVLYPFGWLEQIGLAAAGMAQVLFAAFVLSSEASTTNRWIKLSGILFAVMGLSFGIIISFHTDAGLGITSLGGGIHVVTVIILAALFLANCLILSRAIGHHPDSSTIEHFSIIMAAVGLLIAFQLLPVNPTWFIGISERLLAGINLAWMVFAGSHLPHLIEAAEKIRQRSKLS